jgi:biopolymer transport protein TolQ
MTAANSSALQGRLAIPLLAFLVLVSELGKLLQQTGWVARIVLVILFLFSLFSWALIFQKWRLFSQLGRQTDRFLQAFRASQRLPEPKTLHAAAAGSPLVTLYAVGYQELVSQLVNANPHPQKLKSLNAVNVAMHLAAADEIRKMEKWMPWLATTGSVTPFIGLFGTVWGVMDAFEGLGTAGAASLRAVAPGIAEALIATAAGLFTAIPAVIAYNHFLHEIKEFAGRMNNFASEFTAQIEKQYTV